MENPIKMDDLGVKPTIFGNIHFFLQVFPHSDLPYEKKKKPLAASLIRSKLFSVFSALRTWQGFMALGHRDPTAPGVCVALDLHEKHHMSCFFVFGKKRFLNLVNIISPIL